MDVSIFTPPDHAQDVLVERMSELRSDHIDLQFYETLTPAFGVEMQFDSPVIALMVKGEKMLKINDHKAFQYLPGESLIIPSGSRLQIDFPSASMDNPTQCLAFVPDQEVIEQALYDYKHFANEDVTKEHCSIDDLNSHLRHRDLHLLRNMEYLITLMKEENEHRELFINRASRELIVRLLQSSAQHSFLHHFNGKTKSGFTYMADYIRQNISRNIKMDELAKIAGVSKSNFFQQFKHTFGTTPLQYMLDKKMEIALDRLQNMEHMSISEVGFSLGYSDCSYFTKQFKSIYGCTPKQARLQYQETLN